MLALAKARDRLACAALAASLLASAGGSDADEGEGTARSRVKVRISFGHQAPTTGTVAPRLLPGSPGVKVKAPTRTLTVGGGRIAAVTANLSWPGATEPRREAHSIWKYLLETGEPGQVARLQDDPGLQPDAPVLRVELSEDGTRGFSIGIDQLIRHRAMWLPEHHAFVTLADSPVAFARHLASLSGARVLDRVRHEPEATLAEWTGKWEDVGNPVQWSPPWETSWLGTRGHLTGVAARRGSLYKFGLDRWGAVRPDLGSPHKFRFDILWPEGRWAGQQIVDGLPILVTELERSGQRCEIEQFAAPLSDSPPPRRGEIASVVFNRVRLSGAVGPIRVGFALATEDTSRHPELRPVDTRWQIVDRETESVWLEIDVPPGFTVEPAAHLEDEGDPRVEFAVAGELTGAETREVILKVASPPVLPVDRDRLAARDLGTARAETVGYWEDWLARGAQFQVPERTVNQLFRANLWHALMLPRFRTDAEGVDRIDLPYSNFAYGQLDADWPVNQAVYVDYMLYGLRGYYPLAEEELAAMYHSQQRDDGRVAGYADWGVYSPSMLYSIGQTFLLSRDRASFERLLPQSLKALDWCLAEVAKGAASPATPGVVVAPLNDLTHEARAWAFPNAYFVAGLEAFGRALAAYDHPRARGVLEVAAALRADVEREFSRASVKAPVVQVADGTWINFVPSDAMTPRRRLDVWYPTDVDSGPLHLSRLAAIDPRGWLTTAMLNDHEDNLFLNEWGAANEPVYDQQATAYLRRDEPEAALRAFYSMTACAFSHHQLTPLEHRWAWNQYFMPPSTDGAWFELYRNLLLNELGGDGSLFIGQAIPRAWLADGEQIKVSAAPTHYGPVNLTVTSASASGSLTARVEFESERRPRDLIVRLRHPERKPIASVTVNGAEWKGFDPAKEWVRIPSPDGRLYTIVVRY
jgi:hypothetical protein